MNIFALDKDPSVAAIQHCDKHTVKMILEYAQILSTTHRVLDGTPVRRKTAKGRLQTYWELSGVREGVLYKPTHVNHPSVVWTRQHVDNYKYVADLLQFLQAEYTHRYGKVHKCKQTGLIDLLQQTTPDNIPTGVNSAPVVPCAMPDDSKVLGDPVASYRLYYMLHKSHIASWKNREIPTWYLHSQTGSVQ